MMFVAVNRLGKGHGNARPVKELAEVLLLNERSVRELLEDARAHGFLVCNEQDGKGYYLAETMDEVERQYRRDYKRAMSLLVRLKPMRKMLRQAGRLRTAKEQEAEHGTGS